MIKTLVFLGLIQGIFLGSPVLVAHWHNLIGTDRYARPSVGFNAAVSEFGAVFGQPDFIFKNVEVTHAIKNIELLGFRPFKQQGQFFVAKHYRSSADSLFGASGHAVLILKVLGAHKFRDIIIDSNDV
ncbi:hypothetical protein [Yoonia sp. MH D7]